MKARITILLIFVLVLCCSIAVAEQEKRPVVLVFETTKGEGADRELSSATTRAIRKYLRETQRVEAIIFDRESPTVKRAVMEERLLPDQLTSYSSKEERLSVAKVLSFPYAAGAEISVTNGTVYVKLWAARVQDSAHWEVTGSATTVGSRELDLINSMESAASSAVLDLTRVAFSELPIVEEASPLNGTESIALNGGYVPSDPVGPSEHLKKAEEYLEAGDIALAIQSYSKAVNADPSNPALRIKLALAYARKGMFDEAYRELGGAEMIGVDAVELANARSNIEKMESGQEVTLKMESVSQEPDQDMQPNVSNAVDAAVARMAQGDQLWNQGDPDRAAQAYALAIELNPSDWRAYERLAVVNASMSLFTKSKVVLERLAKVQPNPPADVLANRYVMLQKAFDKHFAALLRQYDNESTDFKNRKITRESYYNTIKALAIRLESMAQFVDSMPVPEVKRQINLHRSIACGLMAQAASAMLSYLETNDDAMKSNADTFAVQAKAEFEKAKTLEANVVEVQ